VRSLPHPPGTDCEAHSFAIVFKLRSKLRVFLIYSKFFVLLTVESAVDKRAKGTRGCCTGNVPHAADWLIDGVSDDKMLQEVGMDHGCARPYNT
jgi:hypothetical protein